MSIWKLLFWASITTLVAGCAESGRPFPPDPRMGANREFESPNSMPAGAPTDNPASPSTGVLLRLGGAR